MECKYCKNEMGMFFNCEGRIRNFHVCEKCKIMIYLKIDPEQKKCYLVEEKLKGNKKK